MNKIKDSNYKIYLKNIIQECKKNNQTIGYTSGCFDIFTSGHSYFLREVKRQCDVLIVAVNSDSSVRSIKGDKRPINSEEDRILVLENSKYIDHMFLFDDLNNKNILEYLKPDIYFKPDTSTLTSRSIVEGYGGKVILIPRMDISTTSIYEKIANLEKTKCFSEDSSYEKVLIVDRDGVINKDVSYLDDPDEFVLLDNVLEGLSKFKEMGFSIFILTAQNGISLGYMTKHQFYQVNRRMLKMFHNHSIHIDQILFSTKSVDENGLPTKLAIIKKIINEYKLKPSSVVVVGDKTSDIYSGECCNCITIGMETGVGLQDKDYNVTPNYVASDLFEAANYIEILK